MKTFAFAALATVISTGAFAQDSSLAYRGANSRAGGTAYLLNDGGRVAAPATRRASPIPLAYGGANSRAGGTAYLLNSETGRR